MIDQTKLKKKVKSKLLSQRALAIKSGIENTKFHRWLTTSKKVSEEDAIRIKDSLQAKTNE